MEVEREVARHYTQTELTRSVLAALRQAGKDPEALATGDLSGVDEFHSGWRPLTLALASELAPPPGTRLLDVGAGIGGPARHFAEAYGCDVTGIDLTPAFVELATELTARTGLADRVRFVTGSALAMPFPDDAFDLATMFHVGMNIADKAALFAEVARVLRPGGRFVVYDLMRTGDAPLPWPMPWADDASTSFVETPARYRELLEAAGFRDRGRARLVAARARGRGADARAPRRRRHPGRRPASADGAGRHGPAAARRRVRARPPAGAGSADDGPPRLTAVSSEALELLAGLDPTLLGRSAQIRLSASQRRRLRLSSSTTRAIATVSWPDGAKSSRSNPVSFSLKASSFLVPAVVVQLDRHNGLGRAGGHTYPAPFDIEVPWPRRCRSGSCSG